MTREAMPTSFSVKAYVDDHAIVAAAETAKEAFAKAVEWHVVHKFGDVSISDGNRSYSIAEFSSVIAVGKEAESPEGEIMALRGKTRAKGK